MEQSSSAGAENANLQNADMLLSRIEDLKKENRDLNKVVSDVSHLVSYTRVDSQIHYLITRLKETFIPETMCFFVQPPRGGELRQYYYTQLQKTDHTLSPECFTILSKYFDDMKITSNNGFAAPFDNILDEIKTVPQELLDIKPKYVIPLFGIGGVFAIILISAKADGEPYNYSEQTYIHRIFSVLAVTMQNGLHYEVSITDPKTGLYTYDYFKTRMEDAISLCKRYNRTSAMLIIDIDFFKRFNDTYGHLVGDKVLVTLAQTLKKAVRDNDCVARFGGEEFSILLSECTADSVFDVAERIRKSVEQIELWEEDQKLSITISIGACLVTDIKGLTPTYVFKRADDALYYSKQNGRNRSTVHKIGLMEAAELVLAENQ